MGVFIRNMPAGMFYLILAFAIGAAIALVVIGRQARRRAALVQAMPTTNIGMAVDGYVEFEGRTEAVDGPPLVTPLTGQPCAWYHAQVRKDVGTRHKQSGDGWSTIYEATSAAPFLLRDGTGVCAVHPYGADVTPTDKSVWYGATPIPSDRNPAKVGPTESAEGMVTVQGTSDTKYRYFEERIYLGDPLLVLGQFTRARPAAGDDADEEDSDLDVDEDADEGEDEEDGLQEAADEVILNRRLDDEKLVGDLYTRVGNASPGWISGGARTSPFIVTTSLQAIHIAQSDIGGQAAQSLALGPLAIAALMLYARFG